jgi:hypothetical protein
MEPFWRGGHHRRLRDMLTPVVTYIGPAHSIRATTTPLGRTLTSPDASPSGSDAGADQLDRRRAAAPGA